MRAVSELKRGKLIMNIQNSLPDPRIGDLWVNPHTNEVLYNQDETGDPSLRHYFGRDVDAALLAWGALEDEIAALDNVKKVLDAAVRTERSSIHEVYFPDSRFQSVCDGCICKYSRSRCSIHKLGFC